MGSPDRRGGSARGTRAAALIALASAVSACASSGGAGAGGGGAPGGGVTLAPGAGVVGPGSADYLARAEATAAAFTAGDVEFMSSMIPHHAQAVRVSGWCVTRTERNDVRSLCERMSISQRDEIRMMRRWLADRGQVVPDSTATSHVMRMGDMVHEMLMPGMLTDPELVTLEAARGPLFDRLFLTGMIRHHAGAIDMVEQLYAQPGAGQEDTVFRFASDVLADQSAEIQRMLMMLDAVPN